MWYRLPLMAVDGTRYSFVGFKTMQPSAAIDVWADTTTLYVTVRRDDEQGPVVGRGVLRIAPADFAAQLGTMSTTGPVGHVERLRILAQFGERFAGVLVHDYGHVIAAAVSLRRHAPPRQHRPLRVPPPSVHAYRSLDGLDLRLTRYAGGSAGTGRDLPRPGRQPADVHHRHDRDELRRVPRRARLRRVGAGVAGLDAAADVSGTASTPTRSPATTTRPPSTTCAPPPGATTCTGSATASAR